MNNLITINQSPTMSSREIAELTGKRHAHAIRDIKKLLEELKPNMDGFENVGVSLITRENGQISEIMLPKRECELLVMGYSVPMRALVYDRWQELESQAAPKLLTSRELLNMNLDALDKIEALEADNHEKTLIIEEQAPKVAFVDRFVDGSKLYTLTEASKILRFRRKDFVECLTRDKYLYRTSGVLVPYENPKCTGLFEVKTGVSEHGRNFTQTKITAEGLNKFSDIYSGELLGDLA